jgi:site-specific DNA recombinase
MRNLAVAIYARVSSDQQTQTIASQVAALRDRVAADGCILLPECEFLEDGDRGATLIRPG